MNVAICFGGYCPMHRGHLDCIMRAKKENDKCFVVVCGYDDEPRSIQIGLNLDKRVALIKEFFRNDEQVIVLKINDTELGIDESMSDKNWKIWHNAVINMVNEYVDNYTITYYVAEGLYYKKITNLLKVDTILVDKVLPISGTKLRAKPVKYWNYIIPTFRPYLTKNILIIGTASEGKTTLVQDIHKYYGIPYTTEFGRDYMEDKKIHDTDLTVDDFTEFLVGQRKYIQDAVRYPANGGVTIHDTDNMVTLMYAKAYVDDPSINISKKDYDFLENLAKKLQNGINWNHIFLIKPASTFVNDGTRYMKQSTMDERVKNYNLLVGIINDFGLWNKVTVIDNGPNQFYKNFEQVKEYIDKLYD